MSAMIGTSAFKARVTPASKASTLSRYAKCLYGVSIGAAKPMDVVAEGYKWAAGRFSRCAILLGDGLHRITLELQEGLEEFEAFDRAVFEGEKALQEIHRILGFVPEVFRSSELIHRSEFKRALMEIEVLNRDQPEFATSLEADATRFVQRQKRSGRLKIAVSDAIQLSKRYLQEETAVYLLLAESGWLIDVYVGDELPTLARIIRGELRNVPLALAQRINIALAPK